MSSDWDNGTGPRGSSAAHCVDPPTHWSGRLQAAECKLETLRVEARKCLAADGFRARSLVLVRRGIILRQRLDRAGRPVAVDIVGSGAAFVVPCEEDVHRSAYLAIDRTLYCTLVDHQLANAFAGPAVGDLHALHCDIAYRLARISEARGRPNVRSRVAATLSTLADTLNPPRGRRHLLPAALLQRDVAALASTRHESVCRILRDFSSEGLVRYGPDGIEIIDYERLAAL